MAAVTVPPELWSKFDDELQTLIEGNHTAEKSYTVGKGMSLASIAVGSVAMRLSKVRAMAQKRDLQSTKVALDKATVKIREAAFTSSGDPEGVTLGKNLQILASLIGVLDRMENPTSARGTKTQNRDTARTRAAAVAKPQRRNEGDDEVEPSEVGQAGAAADKRAIGGVYRDLGIIEPDDDPLSCLAEEVDSAETATKTSSSSRRGGKRGTPKERKVSSAMDVVEPPEPAASESNPEAPGIDLEVTNTLRKQLRRASADDYWLRLTLAYSLEEQGERWADAGNLSASCSAYSEASELFRTCSEQLPSEPECLLRQWMTARRANEVGYTAVSPDVKVLRRCIEICTGNETTLSEAESIDEVGPGSCNKHPVCYEAHLELVGVLLERGRFERCTQACRHILDEHDEDDAEAMFSMAQALEARGLSEEAQKTASRASFLLSAIP
eukprot:g16797.t1